MMIHDWIHGSFSISCQRSFSCGIYTVNTQDSKHIFLRNFDFIVKSLYAELNSCLGIYPNYLPFLNALDPIFDLSGISLLCTNFEIRHLPLLLFRYFCFGYFCFFSLKNKVQNLKRRDTNLKRRWHNMN